MPAGISSLVVANLSATGGAFQAQDFDEGFRCLGIIDGYFHGFVAHIVASQLPVSGARSYPYERKYLNLG